MTCECTEPTGKNSVSKNKTLLYTNQLPTLQRSQKYDWDIFQKVNLFYFYRLEGKLSSMFYPGTFR